MTDDSVLSYASRCLIVDAHTHIFPEELCRDRETLFDRDAWFHALYVNRKASLVAGEHLLTSMHDASIDHAVICGFPWKDPVLCMEHNVYMATVAANAPSRVSWLGVVSPLDPHCVEAARWCFEHGAVGLGELNADAQDFDLRNSRQLAGLVDICLGASRPLMLHASEPIGHNYPGKGSSTPEKLLDFVADAPDLTVIAAHWGGGLPFYELMPEVARIARNVVYDSAASTYLYDFRVFRAVIDVAGMDRVLFGSDYPLLRQARFLERVLGIAWKSEEEQRMVLGENAARLFNLPHKRALPS